MSASTGSTQDKVFEAAEAMALDIGIDPCLVQAIVTVESRGVPWACRFEPEFRYFKDVELWAAKLGQSIATERTQQATSWGPMQVMGAVARELQFVGHLTQLVVPDIGLRYGCLKLKTLTSRYKNLDDAISAYNAGSPIRKPGGQYRNQEYVDKVNAALKKFRQ